MFARERLAEKIGLPEARIQVSNHGDGGDGFDGVDSGDGGPG